MKQIAKKLKKYSRNESEAKILFGQFFHETGGGTSPLYLLYNNLFGMKQPQQRKTFARGVALGHAKFDSVDDSIKDLMLWLGYNKVNIGGDPEQYAKILKSKGYYTDDVDNYALGIMNGIQFWPL